ncbi:MAG: class I SAM-dependent methyltransferase [Limnochordia bacterium]|jgi:ubiquinone/menaquinone biosynthesis C-methylase UbiE|nr:class I SAM-dependent methyltransferase [Limnochordia bacterium]
MTEDLGRYQYLALVYDRMKSEVDYPQWGQYVIQIWQHYEHAPETVLDLACGTGGITLYLAQQGYNMTGVDLSEDMLALADEKFYDSRLVVPLLQQDMRYLNTGTSFDAVICLCDSINYLDAIDDVKQCFGRVYQCLRPGGLFVFDVNTALALERFYGTNVYYDQVPGGELKWETSYDKNKGRCVMDLTFSITVGGVLREYRERHIEQAYPMDQLAQALDEKGFTVLDVFDGFTLLPAKSNSYRWNFVAQRSE